MEVLYGFDPMKTVRPDEFASPYSATSIISIANIDDNQTRCSLSILTEFTVLILLNKTIATTRDVLCGLSTDGTRRDN
ncbi:hypothetical protein HID58_033900 [Brassica napus]|uniref:Uncharacterized protein n=1 Tax=Brassica napus TaxID=3708 RepID=A0ABQ8C0J2_BRANA|nr:hypothetical protein HID58_033900 [Brassica napus]